MLEECDIKNSSDTSIKNPIFCDINKLIQQTKIDRIFTTGKTAFNLYQKYVYPKTGIKAVYLPSTSPANCAFSFDNLVEQYKIITRN